MAQQYLKFNNYVPPNVDQDGYQVALATTSTEDSGRTMRGQMHNVPLFTTEAYNLTWKNISVRDVSNILKQVVNKSGFYFNHLNLYSGQWENTLFYASNFNSPVINLNEGVEKVKELKFQVTGGNPI